MLSIAQHCKKKKNCYAVKTSGKLVNTHTKKQGREALLLLVLGSLWIVHGLISTEEYTWKRNTGFHLWQSMVSKELIIDKHQKWRKRTRKLLVLHSLCLLSFPLCFDNANQGQVLHSPLSSQKWHQGHVSSSAGTHQWSCSIPRIQCANIFLHSLTGARMDSDIASAAKTPPALCQYIGKKGH